MTRKFSFMLLIFVIFIFWVLRWGLVIDWFDSKDVSQAYVSGESPSELSVSSVLGNSDVEGFSKALEPRRFEFPQDHGPHPDFQNEWWYFTGNLVTQKGRRFGYHLTLFRNSLRPQAPPSGSAWKTNQIMMGHFAITDVENEKHYSFERFSRLALGLAGAQASPFRVWLEDWEIQGRANEDLSLILTASQEGLSLTLTLENTKPYVLQGNQGHSQKGAQAGNASYYYSFTRLAAQGHLKIDEEQFDVKGSSWMDREWSTSALENDQVGWDWFALQLDTGEELMYYQLRKKDGTPSPQSAGVWVHQDSQTIKLSHDQVSLQILETWQSESSKVYPNQWRFQEASLGIDLKIIPFVQNQEMQTTFLYWEGAVEVQGTYQGRPIQGVGFVEMTGY